MLLLLSLASEEGQRSFRGAWEGERTVDGGTEGNGAGEEDCDEA